MRLLPWVLALGACGGAPVPPPAEVALPSPDPVLREATRDAVARAEREGWSLERVGETFFAVTDRAHVEAVTVPPRSCRLFLLVHASGVVEAAAALYLADGRRVARDFGGSGPPMVGACASEAPLRAFWHVSVRGAGLVRGLEFAVEGPAAEALDLSEPGSESPLTSALRQRGFVRRGEDRVLRLASEEPVRFPLELEAQRCLTLVAEGAQASITLTEGGRVVARDGEGAEQAVQLCADEEPRSLEVVLSALEAGEVRVRRHGVDRSVLGGEGGLWLGERLPVVGPVEPPPGARAVDLVPAEVREVSLPASVECTRVRIVAGEGSRGVWLGEPGPPLPEAQRCVEGASARFGSAGGGRVWLSVEGASRGLTPRRPAQRGARR